jgi:hypothetical protein
MRRQPKTRGKSDLSGLWYGQGRSTYQFDIDLPMINACQLCILLLTDPKMADRLGVPDPWAESRPKQVTTADDSE